MEITYLDHSCFRLKGKDATVVCDPYSPEVGLKLPKNVTADIVTVSHDHYDHNNTAAVSGSPMVLHNPGEYEIKGVEVMGISTFHDTKEGAERGKNVVFKIKIDGVIVVHLGDLGHALGEKAVELLNNVTVLLIPVGGRFTIDALVAKEIVGQLEPQITIPMHYQNKKLADTVKNNLAPIDTFLKEMGKEGVVPQPKLIVKPSALPEEPQIVILSD